jgi:hypothetical protein
MQKRVSDLPALLPPGVHPVTVEWLQQICVGDFPLSRSRTHIWEGFNRIYRQLLELAVPCRLIVDGSFLTQEIEPGDIDFSVCVTPEFYESCDQRQLALLDWIGNDITIKQTHLCDCYLCVEYPEGHPEWFDGIQDRAFGLISSQ